MPQVEAPGWLMRHRQSFVVQMRTLLHCTFCPLSREKPGKATGPPPERQHRSSSHGSSSGTEFAVYPVDLKVLTEVIGPIMPIQSRMGGVSGWRDHLYWRIQLREKVSTMQRNSLLHGMTSIAVCAGICFSSVATAFDGAPGRISRDIQLSEAGSLAGRVVSTAGEPLADAAVRLQYSGNPVAETRTNDDGRFVIRGVRGGVHTLNVGSSSTSLRLWSNGSAPAAARDEVVVAGSEFVIRGQYADPCPPPACIPCSPGVGAASLLSIAAIATATTAIVIAVNAEDDVDDLKALASP